MVVPLHPRLRAASEVTEGLVQLTQVLARAAARAVRPERAPRNATLRPGPGTPMWNALVLTIRPHLRRRGEKSNLGRELGVPPQRIHEYFVARTATPDAERTLQVLHWLTQRGSSRSAKPSAPPAKPPQRAGEVRISRNT